MPEFLEITVDKFVFRVAADRLYRPDGVWCLVSESNGVRRVTLGVTDYLQQVNGDVAFAHVKPVGTSLAASDEVAEIETIKANVSVPCPVTGTLIELNPVLGNSPETINQDPYGDGWLAVIETTNWENDRAQLLAPEAYLAAMRAQAEEELGKQ